MYLFEFFIIDWSEDFSSCNRIKFRNRFLFIAFTSLHFYHSNFPLFFGFWLLHMVILSAIITLGIPTLIAYPVIFSIYGRRLNSLQQYDYGYLVLKKSNRLNYLLISFILLKH